MAFKPDRYSSVSPYLIVNGAQDAVAFLIRVFDATPLRMVAGKKGTLRHGEVRIDDTVVMLCDAIAGWPAIPAHVHIYVRDVEATYARAMKAGATPVQKPVQKDDSDRRGGFRDAGGTTWWVGQQIEEWRPASDRSECRTGFAAMVGGTSLDVSEPMDPRFFTDRT